MQDIRIRFLKHCITEVLKQPSDQMHFKIELDAIFNEVKCCGRRISVTQEFLPGVPPLLSSQSASLKENSEIEVVLLTCCDFVSLLL